MIFSLAQDFRDAVAAMPREHPKHRMLELLEEARPKADLGMRSAERNEWAIRIADCGLQNAAFGSQILLRIGGSE